MRTDRRASLSTAELQRRLLVTTETAHRLLGLQIPSDGDPDPDMLAGLISAVSVRLTGGRHPWEEGGAEAHAGAMISAHQDQLERLRQRYENRVQAFDRVREAMRRLRAVTVPSAMLAQAPAELCAASDLQRVILSLITKGMMVAESVHVRDDPDSAESVLQALRRDPPRLEHPLIESEALRRRRATIVGDADMNRRVHRPMADIMGWRTYLIAPLVVGRQVIGVLHADHGPDAPLDVLDRDIVWEFSSGLAQAFESASLQRTIRTERAETRRFLQWLDARSSALSDVPVELGTHSEIKQPPPEILAGMPRLSGREDRAMFEGVITRRELDVLRLLAEGLSNKAIATRLVVSPATVKFHVNGILRKLQVSNRAEAVSRYLSVHETASTHVG